MSGEILRGVLTQNLHVARLKTYKIEVENVGPGQILSANTKIETGTYFLAMQYNMTVWNPANYGAILQDASYVDVTILKTSFKMSAVPLLYPSQLSSSINQSAALPDYVMLEDNEYIQISINNATAAALSYSFTLTGVEYRNA